MIDYLKENPIFILSFSWRTGSTLLQRVINSTGEALLWGEPHVMSNMFNGFRRLRELSVETEWSRTEVANNGWESSWAPTMQPELDYIDTASKSMLYELYGKPVKDQGVNRWGFKEVRADAANNARFLKRIYPNCKIVFHYRDPFEMYESVRNTDFFSEFKDPYQPVRIWNANAVEVVDLLKKDFDGFLISHEELLSSKEKRDDLFDFLEINSREKVESVLSKKTGGTSSGSLEQTIKEAVSQIVAPGCVALDLFSKVNV